MLPSPPGQALHVTHGGSGRSGPATCFLYLALRVASVYIVLQYSGQGMYFLGHPTSTCVSVLPPETWHVNELGNWAG